MDQSTLSLVIKIAYAIFIIVAVVCFYWFSLPLINDKDESEEN